MGAQWVAGGVRARALARRRLGRAGTRRIAAGPTLADALRALVDTPYGHDVRVDQTLAEAEHAVRQTLLWHLRVLAGWLPRAGVDQVRQLAGWFELANVDEHARRLAGGDAGAPAYRLGALATAWPRLSTAASLDELRDLLATSPWGDPGAATPWAMAAGTRLAWAGRVASGVPAAEAWAAGAAALLIARETVLLRRRLGDRARERAADLLNSSSVDAVTLPELAERLPGRARWVLQGVDTVSELWRAETRWWTRLEHDGFALLHRFRFDETSAIGAAAVLAADAWRLRAALEAAARGGPARGVFDALG